MYAFHHYIPKISITKNMGEHEQTPSKDKCYSAIFIKFMSQESFYLPILKSAVKFRRYQKHVGVAVNCPSSHINSSNLKFLKAFNTFIITHALN